MQANSDVDLHSSANTPASVSLADYQRANRWARLREILIITLAGWMPQPVGTLVRRILYWAILAKLGKSVNIHGTGVDFVGANCIELNDSVRIMRDTRLNAFAQNSRIQLGEGVYLYRDVDISVTYLGDCTIDIGGGTVIGAFTCIHGPGHIKIGESCLIASHVGIYANNHNFADISRRIIDQGVTRKGIVIEDDCWLGTGVIVLDGVTIGQGSVIGAGAVVTKSIPPYSVAVGVPAKVISSRKELNSNA
jgi:acetyltransferase-like isoleucine patch superfamily enzyme